MTAAPQFHAGVVGDRDAVWLVDDARVLVRRVSNGDERWRATLGFRVQHVAVHDDLLVVVGRTSQRVVAIGFDIGSGQERWRKRFSPRRKVILRGEDPPVDDAGGLRIYEIVDPRTGAGLGRVAKARDELLWRDVSEGYVRTGGDIEELGPDGALRRQQPFTGGDVLAIGATHLVSRSGQDLLFHDRIALLERARLSRGFTVDPSSGRLGPHRMLLRRTDEAGVLFVIVALEPTTRG